MPGRCRTICVSFVRILWANGSTQFVVGMLSGVLVGRVLSNARYICTAFGVVENREHVFAGWSGVVLLLLLLLSHSHKYKNIVRRTNLSRMWLEYIKGYTPYVCFGLYSLCFPPPSLIILLHICHTTRLHTYEGSECECVCLYVSQCSYAHRSRGICFWYAAAEIDRHREKEQACVGGSRKTGTSSACVLLCWMLIGGGHRSFAYPLPPSAKVSPILHICICKSAYECALREV